MRSRALRVYAVLLGLTTALDLAWWVAFSGAPSALGPVRTQFSAHGHWIELAFAVLEAIALAVAATGATVPRAARVALWLAVVLGGTALACRFAGADASGIVRWLDLRRLFEVAALTAAAVGAWNIAPRTGGGALGGLFGLLVTTLAVSAGELVFAVHVTNSVRFALRVGATLGVAALALLSEYEPSRGDGDATSPYRDGHTRAAIPARKTGFEIVVATCCGAALWQYVVGFPLRPARVDAALGAIALVSHVLLWPAALVTSRSLRGTGIGKSELALARRVGTGCALFSVVALACLWVEIDPARTATFAAHVDPRLLVDPKTALVVVGMLDLAAAFVLVEALLVPMASRGRWRVRTLTPVTVVAIAAALVPASWREAPRDVFVWTMLAVQAVAMLAGSLVFVRRLIAMLHIVLLSTVSYASDA